MSLFPNPPSRSEKKYSVVPSNESAGAPSKAVLLTVGPRFTGVDHGSAVVARVATHRSWPPTPPGRPVASDEMNISRPSRRIAVRVSRYGPFSSVTSTPRPPGSASPARGLTRTRWVTQMSSPPKPPGRLETKYRLNPSFEIDGCWSLDAELTTGPRFAGAPHGPYAG